MKKFALISVSDKSKIIEFARDLNSLAYRIIATGNTCKLLLQNQIECIEIRDFTGFPEIFSGRVKTLHPKIFGGILMRRDDPGDIVQAAENAILPIDIICVNLYPFPLVVESDEYTLSEKIENIDIGGPSLIRASAKNYRNVSVLTDPSQYEGFISELRIGEIGLATREKLAYEAFSYTSYYDTLIANFLEKEFAQPRSSLRLNYKLAFDLRYGENPHQQASLFGNFEKYFEILHGKELSYNNIVDLAAAFELVYDLPLTACAIIKHTNPCGAASGKDLLDAFESALSCDPVSAFGGIVAFNQTVDKRTADKLNEIFLEIICAPGFTAEALELLKTKKNRRIIEFKKLPDKNDLKIKSVPGGLLLQERDNSSLDTIGFNTVTSRKCLDNELEDLKFAWVVCKHTKSNAIVYVKNKKTIGVGAGQMSRIDSAKIAAVKALQFGHNLQGAVAASDAFFPFSDGLLEIASMGITAVIQPGGSVRDAEVITAADGKNITMIFTGIRNFNH